MNVLLDVLLYGGVGLIALVALSLTPPGVQLRKRMMARSYTAMQRKYEAYIASRKRELLASLSGTVLELGPGNGANFEHLPAAVERWIGIEPNPYMHAELRDAAARRGVAADFRAVTAEGMQVPDGSVDVVLSTLVLCSVPDPERVLRDAHRVLAPGGQLVFIEHVAAPSGTGLRRWQRRLRPLWRWFADGCCPDRELEAAIRGAGFASVELEAFTVPRGALPRIVSPQIAGVATKAR